MILAHHISVTSGWYASRINNPPLYLYPLRPWTSVQSFFEWSPLHMLYASNGVFIFFVVSGFILVGPVRAVTARAYATGRLVRLYVPVVAAVVPAVMFALAYHSHSRATTSFYVNQHLQYLHVRHVVGAAWIMDGSTELNRPLWTMRYEVVFSMVLPGVLWAATWLKRTLVVRCAVILGLVSLTCLGGAVNMPFLTYLPVFFVGVVLADAPAPRRGALWLILAGVVVMNLDWTIGGFHVRTPYVVFLASTVVGAALIVQGVRSRSLVSRALETRPMQFLGRRSYSIYLLHMPVIYFVWVCVPTSDGLRGEIAHIAIALVILGFLVEVFYWLVERRAIRWSRRTTKVIETHATSS